MRKIPTIFLRDEKNMRFVKNEVNPGCEWVFDGEGVATRKYDGTCCMVKNGNLWKRREVKPGKNAPSAFLEVEHDQKTGKRFGWMPVTEDKEDRYQREAFALYEGVDDGTYELCGPKVQGNPEGFSQHVLKAHGVEKYPDFPREFGKMAEWFLGKDIEGVVFHHPDGRMAKIKKRDFGLKRSDRGYYEGRLTMDWKEWLKNEPDSEKRAFVIGERDRIAEKVMFRLIDQAGGVVQHPCVLAKRCFDLADVFLAEALKIDAGDL